MCSSHRNAHHNQICRRTPMTCCRTIKRWVSQLAPGRFATVIAAVAISGGIGSVSADPLAVEAVSNRADLVSGGDVLVRVTLPAGVNANQAVLSVNGQALASPLHAAPDGRGFLALVTGLNLGHNSLVLAGGGSSVQLDVTNYPIEGPVFSGPHL